MRALISVGFMLLISGCAASTVVEAPVPATVAAAPTITAAQEAVIAAPQNPFYTPLVGEYLAAANRDLPKKYPYVTVEKVEFVNRDLVTVFKYDSFEHVMTTSHEKGSMTWWEYRKICRDPLFLELNRNGFFLYRRTIFKYQGTSHIGSLSPITRESCGWSGHLS
ncbi:MAG: hypothetical protein V7727_20905 [Sneathiella sp.]